MVMCVDACFVTRRGLHFVALPLSELQKCCEQRNEMANWGVREFVFNANITNLEDGTNFELEATDLLVRIGS